MIFYKGGYKYQLEMCYCIDIPFLKEYAIIKPFYNILNGQMNISSGYAWDGASGPTWDSKSTMRASLVHDVIYQCMADGDLPRSVRDDADKLLYKMLIEDGAWKLRAKLWLQTLRWFGRPEKKKVEIAP